MLIVLGKDRKARIIAFCVALFILITIIMSVAFGGAGAAREPEAAAAAADNGLLVGTVTPQTGSISVANEYIGLIEASVQAMVFPKAAGEVLAVHFSEGDTVRAGEVLFVIDSYMLESTLLQSQTALALAQARADQNFAMAAMNLNNFDFNLANGHDMTIRNALNTIDMAYAGLENALLQGNNAALALEGVIINRRNTEIAVNSAAIASENAGLAVEGALIARNNVDNSIEIATIAGDNAWLSVSVAQRAQTNARLTLEAAENRLDSATAAFNSARRQLNAFVDEGVYPLTMLAMMGLGLDDQIEEQLRDARLHAQLAMEAAELGVEQARNAHELAKLNVDQARGGAALSDINLTQALSASDSTALAILQAKNGEALSLLGIEQAQNAVSSVELGIAQAENGVAMSQLGIEQALLNLEKAYDMYETALVMVGQQRRSIEVQVELARLTTNFSDQHIALERLENDLNNFTITAPISGVIERRNVEPFGMASPQAPAFIISDTNGKTVSFRIPRGAYTNVNLGDTVTLSDGVFDYAAVITEKAATIDPAGMFTVKASVNGQSAALLIGASVRVMVDTEKTDGAVLVPISTVYYDNGAPFVYAVNNNFAVKTYVTTGIFDADYIEIISGITGSDTIINTWSAKLADGVAVTLIGEEENK
jgi:RND family efflux transporter MFP subunit